MLEFKVRTVCCLHPVLVLLFASVQRISLSIPTVMGDTSNTGVSLVQLSQSP
jgi:hypothetical protein